MADAAKNRWVRLGAGVLASLIVLVGVALYVRHRLRAPAVDHAVELVPADADAYLHVFLKPSTSQRRALQSLLERFPATDEDKEAEAFIDELLRNVLGRFDIGVEEGAGEWLGDEVALFFAEDSETPTVLLAVEDADEGLAEVLAALRPGFGAPDEARAYDGVGYRLLDDELVVGVLRDFVVIGEEDAFRSGVDASIETSLADEDRFGDLEGKLDDHRLALLYVDDASAVVPQLPPVAGIALDERLTTFASGLRVVNEGLVLDAVSDTTGDLAPFVHGLRDATVALPGFEVLERLGFVGTRLKTNMLEGYEPVLAIDASRVPSLARTALLAAIDESWRPILGRFITLELGVRSVGDHARARLAVTFSDA